jgi:hypothetical protein
LVLKNRTAKRIKRLDRPATPHSFLVSPHTLTFFSFYDGSMKQKNILVAMRKTSPAKEIVPTKKFIL